MARRRKNNTDDFVKAIAAILLLGYGTLANFWKSLSPADKTLFAVLAISALIVGVAFIVVLLRYRNQRRRIAWERAMRTWNESSKGGNKPLFQTAKDLSPDGLEKFAAQTFRKMGYSVVHTGQSGDHGVDVHLTNPNNQIELVQCKQWNKPVGEPEVRDLMGAMMHENAVRGYIWAPGGFSDSARRWAKGKPIVLADNDEIGRIIESIYTN